MIKNYERSLPQWGIDYYTSGTTVAAADTFPRGDGHLWPSHIICDNFPSNKSYFHNMSEFLAMYIFIDMNGK